MKRMRWVVVVWLALVACAAWADDGQAARPIQVFNRLRAEYDDNIYQSDEDPTSSFKVIEELEFLVNLDLQQTFLGVRYRPSYVWWQDREPDDTDFQHEVEFVLNQTFTPRLSLSVADSLLISLVPELEEHGYIVRQNQDYYYNTFNATMGYLLRPATRIEGSGRYIMLQYDNEEVGENEDFDLYVAGLTLRQIVTPAMTVMGNVRVEQVEYDGVDRGSDSVYAGAGLEQTFSPNMLGSLSLGYQNKEFNDTELGSESAPYADAALTFLPSPATRVTVGGGFSMFEADVYPYANQDRSQVYLSLAHDVSARVAMYLSGAYQVGDYSAEYSVDQGGVNDGTEELVLVSARVTYKLNRSNWLEAGWQYQDFSSELEWTDGTTIRVPYERNRLDVGWKTQF